MERGERRGQADRDQVLTLVAGIDANGANSLTNGETAQLLALAEGRVGHFDDRIGLPIVLDLRKDHQTAVQTEAVDATDTTGETVIGEDAIERIVLREGKGALFRSGRGAAPDPASGQ